MTRNLYFIISTEELDNYITFYLILIKLSLNLYLIATIILLYINFIFYLFIELHFQLRWIILQMLNLLNL